MTSASSCDNLGPWHHRDDRVTVKHVAHTLLIRFCELPMVNDVTKWSGGGCVLCFVNLEDVSAALSDLRRRAQECWK